MTVFSPIKSTRVSQKFSNILVTWGTIWQLRKPLPRSQSWQITLDYEMLNLHETLSVNCQIYLYSLDNGPLESKLLGLPDFAYLLRFLQLEQNFLKHLVMVLWLTFCTRNIFGCFCGVYGPIDTHQVLVPKLECLMFNKRSNAKQVSVPTSTILPITVGLFNSFGHVIYSPQATTWKNIAKLLIYPCIKIRVRDLFFRKCLSSIILSHLKPQNSFCFNWWIKLAYAAGWFYLNLYQE